MKEAQDIRKEVADDLINGDKEDEENYVAATPKPKKRSKICKKCPKQSENGPASCAHAQDRFCSQL